MSRFSPRRNDTTPNELSRSAEPVFLDEHKARQELLSETTTQATRQESVNSPRERKLDGPVDLPLDTQPYADRAPSDLPIEAQWNVLLRVATIVPQQMLAVEQFEVLKANLWSRYSETTMKVILFVGATSASGTSTAAANFAAMLAQEPDSKVLLIDANVRSRKPPNSIRAASGEADPSVSVARLLLTIHPTRDNTSPGPSNLWVLPSDTKCPMSLALFQSEAFDEFLQTARERFKYVIVDTSPLQHCPESLVLSHKADGVILVIESEKTRKRSALWTKQQIEHVGGKLLGVVLNKRRYYIPDWLYKRI